MNNTTTTTFSLASRVSAWWARKREPQRQLALRKRCPPATIAASQIPADVRAAWARHAPDEFPGLATDDGSWLRCSLGLAQFFEACRLQREHGACALPSKAADSVWHAWLQANPESLADWQQRFFGHLVEHRETQHLGASPEECLARTWAGACRSEGLDLIGPKLPLVFLLDGLLRLPTGWAYRHARGTVEHQQINGFGEPAGVAVTHAALSGSCLVAQGLLSDTELQAALRRQQSQSDNGSSGGGSDVSSCDSSDGGCSDGGSSCGSSCGGGGD